MKQTRDPQAVVDEAYAMIEAIRTRPELSAVVLKQINVVRMSWGMPTIAELPCGQIKMAQEDPIARGLSGTTGGFVVKATVTEPEILLTAWREGDLRGTIVIETTPEIRLFICAFDRGLLKRYVAKKVKRADRKVPRERAGSVQA